MQRDLKQIFIVVIIDDHVPYVEAFETERNALRFVSRAAAARGYEVAEHETRYSLAEWLNVNPIDFNCEIHAKYLNR
ncbi:MAG: hypothetical protein ACKO0Z_13535 [Betaproteobacteria bacterium]